MHILNFLDGAPKGSQNDIGSDVYRDYTLGDDAKRVEYRLICSGTLYPVDFLGDWTKSDSARVLLRLPVELLVASQPYDEYPQELALRFVSILVSESSGSTSHSYFPDVEIASDLAALLTLFCRRLVTVSLKSREQFDSKQLPPCLADFPIPAALRVKLSYWTERPLSFLYGLEGVQVKSYRPPSVPLDSANLTETLLALPKMRAAPAIIRAARLYASAMEHIETQPDSCYQLLVSAAETMAGAVLEGWEPCDEDKIASKGGLVSYATKKEKVSKDVAKRLALEASKDNPWSGRKFKKFLIDHLDEKTIGDEDDLFIVPKEFRPRGDEIEKAFGEVYRTRGSMTHSGHSYPASATVGPSVNIPMKAFNSLMNRQRPFPPIGWFERVVNCAICKYIQSEAKQVSSGDGGAGHE